MRNQRQPFQLIPWQNDFIPALLDFSLQTGNGSLEDAVFIFPHARPALYLERQIRLDRRISKPCLMPEILPVHNVFLRLREDFLPPAVAVGKLDQVGLLLECVREEQREARGALNALPTADAQAFFPWGVRLANLFEDCFIHGIEPDNFLYLEDELAEYAAALLGRLSNIHRRYLLKLAERGWTTSGLSAFQIAGLLPAQSIESNLFRRRNIFIAGFYSPTGSEETLFHKLWSECGALVITHGDPALASRRERPHWSCAGLEHWRAKWKTSFEPHGRPLSGGPDVKFYSGYDIHSQLSALQNILQAASESAGTGRFTGETEYDEATAVILPDTDLLLPALHHLQNMDINISMGYPLDKTALNRLVETVLTLQENKRRGGYYWKDCIRLIRHPYLKMLEPRPDAAREVKNGLDAHRHNSGDYQAPNGREQRRQWLEFLRRLEKQLREGRRYVDLPALLEECLLTMEPGQPEELSALVRELADTLLLRWEKSQSLTDVALALEKLCAIMAGRGEKLWPRFPIDAECLYRFMQSVIPQLRNSALAGEQLQSKILFMILRQLIREERVPFDAFPLTALQIMGLLESRLLSFRRVFILEATDDLLPGGNQNDPLLPDALRRELRLPDNFRKQQMTAYYFFRLIAGAEEVHLFWEEGAEAQGLLEAKKLKSRFIEELIWKEERKRGRLLQAVPMPAPGAYEASGVTVHAGISTAARGPAAEADTPLYQLSCAPAPLTTGLRRIPASPAVRDSVRRLLAHKKLSAGKLNSFLSCPLAFYFQELTGLKPLAEVAEGDDPSETGQLLHDAFSFHYASGLGKELRKNEQNLTELVNNFLRTLDASHLPESFPQDALAALRRITPLRLADYLAHQPESTRIMALESEANAALTLADGTVVKLTGRIDRLDRREFAAVEIVDADAEGGPGPVADNTFTEGLIILDYKTGRVTPPLQGFWSDQKLWRELELSTSEDQELLNAVADALQSNIQLPLYLYLLRHGSLDRRKGYVAAELDAACPVVNAAWIELRAEGKEYSLFEELGRKELEDILDRKIPALLKFVLSQLQNTRAFTARCGRQCSYCPYAALCVTVAKT